MAESKVTEISRILRSCEKRAADLQTLSSNKHFQIVVQIRPRHGPQVAKFELTEDHHFARRVIDWVGLTLRIRQRRQLDWLASQGVKVDFEGEGS